MKHGTVCFTLLASAVMVMVATAVPLASCSSVSTVVSDNNTVTTLEAGIDLYLDKDCTIPVTKSEFSDCLVTYSENDDGTFSTMNTRARLNYPADLWMMVRTPSDVTSFDLEVKLSYESDSVTRCTTISDFCVYLSDYYGSSSEEIVSQESYSNLLDNNGGITFDELKPNVSYPFTIAAQWESASGLIDAPVGTVIDIAAIATTYRGDAVDQTYTVENNGNEIHSALMTTSLSGKMQINDSKDHILEIVNDVNGDLANFEVAEVSAKGDDNDDFIPNPDGDSHPSSEVSFTIAEGQPYGIFVKVGKETGNTGWSAVIKDDSATYGTANLPATGQYKESLYIVLDENGDLTTISSLYDTKVKWTWIVGDGAEETLSIIAEAQKQNIVNVYFFFPPVDDSTGAGTAAEASAQAYVIEGIRPSD